MAPVIGLVTAPLRAIPRLIALVEDLADGMRSVEREMRGMRADVRDVIGEVQGLRADLGAVDERVEGIRSATVALDGQLDSVADRLRHVDAIASRFSRLAGRRATAPAADGDAASSDAA